MVLHTLVRKFVFNLRAAYQREAEKAFAHLTSIGIEHIAILHVDDSFGQDGLQGAHKELSGAHLAPVLVAKFDRNTPDFSAIGQTLSKTPVLSVLVVGAGLA